MKDKAGYKAGILAREGLGSTAIGEGIAIPHAKVEAVAQPGRRLWSAGRGGLRGL